MSHLAEVYALACGVPLSQPEIMDAFFPLEHPLDKVILIHSFAGGIKEENGQKQATFPAKIYDHFDEVVALLKPIVEPAGYRIYQIGAPGEPPLRGVESLCGRTTMHQCAYLVKNCALLIGNDSQWVHIRGAERKPLVAVYGPTSKPHFPYWQDSEKTVLIESHRRGGRPSYGSHEGPKTINWITPEQVVQAALKLIPETTPQLSHHSLYIGEAYSQYLVELVPDVIVSPSVTISGPLVIRMDYAPTDPEGFTKAEQLLFSNLQHRKCCIVLDREINLTMLSQFKPQIMQMKIEVDKLSAGWIKAVKRLGIPVGFFSNESDPEKLSRLRLALHSVVLFDHIKPPVKEDFMKGAAVYLNKELDKDFKWDTLRFKTHKALLSDNKVYLSKAHWLAGKNTPSIEQNSDLIIDNPTFWTELPCGYFYTT